MVLPPKLWAQCRPRGAEDDCRCVVVRWRRGVLGNNALHNAVLRASEAALIPQAAPGPARLGSQGAWAQPALGDAGGKQGCGCASCPLPHPSPGESLVLTLGKECTRTHLQSGEILKGCVPENQLGFNARDRNLKKQAI